MTTRCESSFQRIDVKAIDMRKGDVLDPQTVVVGGFAYVKGGYAVYVDHFTLDDNGVVQATEQKRILNERKLYTVLRDT